VKVPTGPKNAKVKLEEVFDDLAGIKTRLEPRRAKAQSFFAPVCLA
jgi:hypothetical protein